MDGAPCDDVSIAVVGSDVGYWLDQMLVLEVDLWLDGIGW